MRAIDFRGFRFGNVHTSDLNLEVVSSSNRYEARVLPAPTDVVADIPGSDGQYYFGSTYKNREITCNVAFDSVSEEIYRKIRQLFATDQLQDLVFDEEPYKTWKAKLKSKPEFKSLCFTDRETGERVYKGDGKLVFICYFPYAFGFDKYIVRAADYYMLNPPEQIICEISNNDDDIFFNTVDAQIPERWLPQDIKYHYNTNPSDYIGGENGPQEELRDEPHQNRQGRQWEPNDKTPWKTGFPTPEQVQAGELYFDTEDGNRSIIDVRGYWDNIPEWQHTAKLLTTPTLDFEQELMYMPQYSKVDFINMDIGFQSYRPMIGSRILVYNPGDMPIDWEIKINENKRGFWSMRGGKFRVRRFNVDRLTIPQAVDWCGLTTYEPADNKLYKYGNRYFRRRVLDKQKMYDYIDNNRHPTIYKVVEETFEPDKVSQEVMKPEEIKEAIRQGYIPADKEWIGHSGLAENWETPEWLLKKHREDPVCQMWHRSLKMAFNLDLDDRTGKMIGDLRDIYNYLGPAHPHHCYYIEPIPKERLGHFIKLFYWQTIYWRGHLTANKKISHADDWMNNMPEDFWANRQLARIADMTHPLVQFLQQFYEIDERGYILDRRDNSIKSKVQDLSYEEGVEFANRYDELYKKCITDEERYELYWTTLKDLFKKFIPMLPEGVDFDEFYYNYINNPAEYIGTDTRDLDYQNEVFNAFKYPSWITEDYIEIDTSQLSGVTLIQQYLAAIGEDVDSVFTGRIIRYDSSKLNKSQHRNLKSKIGKLIRDGDDLNCLLDDSYFLNTETRMLYSTENPYGMEFIYKPSKNIMNEAITKGKWFKLPPGWSVLCIEPVVDESLWGGKRWIDARPFDWGYGGDLNGEKTEAQQLFDFIYVQAQKYFFYLQEMTDVTGELDPAKTQMISSENIKDEDRTDMDEVMRFKLWYEENINNSLESNDYFSYQFYRKKQQDAEYAFLKIINEMWQIISPYYTWTMGKGIYFDPSIERWENDKVFIEYDINGRMLRNINGDISDWWWYACNFLWANFPPIYWGAADMLNNLQIKYTPLFY